MFYICIATEEKPPRVQFAEHYAEKIERDKRVPQMASVLGDHDGATWKLFTSDSEPFEAAYVRGTTQPLDSETPAKDDDLETNAAKIKAFQTRVDALCLKAGKASKSVLTAPEINDVPLWFKGGYQSQAEMDFNTGKISQEEYNLVMNPHLGGKK